MLLGLLLAIGVMGGGGDEANGMGDPRMNPADIITGDTGTGGGGTGACSVYSGSTYLTCSGGLTQAECNSYAQGGITVTWTRGGSCP